MKTKRGKFLVTGLTVSSFLLILEGLWTYNRGWQKHNSMYFMLLPVMYFLFCLLAAEGEKHNNARVATVESAMSAGKTDKREKAMKAGGTVKWKNSEFLRNLSLWIYILHPLCIIMVRGCAKVAGLTELFVENSLVHYLAVCLVSLGLSAGVALLLGGKKREEKE